jgi:glycosyltransferase involved in cell wall biosynthesis
MHAEEALTNLCVSVVTPFHNTAQYLAQCIESVLAQTCPNFEYILVDNCSSDGSGEIAEEYAKRDPRIRLVRRTSVLPQVRNYNRALEEISGASRYCKIVQADDYIFPNCLQMMVEAFERYETVGLISSYWLKGNEVRGTGFPHATPMMSGREMARMYLRTGLWVFGSPTAVMYRSSLIKKGEPFYDESALHEDTEKCMQILKNWDFGFVNQVLSFSRADNEGVSSAVRNFHPNSLDRYIAVRRYASAFLDAREAAALRRSTRQEYYSVLAEAKLRRREHAFWEYHARGLRMLGESIDRSYLGFRVLQRTLWLALNPGATLGSGLRRLARGVRKGSGSA